MESPGNHLEQSQKRILTSQLPERYGISKTTVYDRMNALHIRTFKENGKAYVSPSDLQLMDDLNIYLKAKQGEIKDFFQQCLDEGRTSSHSRPKDPETEATVPEVTVPEAMVPEAMVPEAMVPESEAIAPQHSVPVAQQPRSPVEKPESEAPSRISMIAQLQAQKGQQTRASDIQEVAEQAQIRAFDKIVAEETMTLIYEATENFTVPGLNEQLEQHRAACREARQGRSAAYEVNDFLAEAVALAMNGSNSSTVSSRSQSPTSNGVSTSA